MPNVSIKRVGSLNSQQVELLTQLLCLPPGQTPTEQWLRDQEFRLQYFPPELVAPKSTLSKLSRKLEFTLKSASDPHLCPTHKVLNPHLIHRIFLLVTDETTRRLGRLARHPGGLPPNVQSFLKRMQMMNSIWMDEGLYRVTFRATPYDARYDKFPTDCEACILASVGGNESLLSDLRAGILGRKRKEQKKNSRLLRIVDGWMDWTGKGDELENSNLVKEIRQCRTLLRAERAKKKKKKKGKPSDKRRRRSVDGASGLTPQPPQGRTKERNERDNSNLDADVNDTIHEISRTMECFDISSKSSLEIDTYSESIYSTTETEEIRRPFMGSNFERLSEMYQNLVNSDA